MKFPPAVARGTEEIFREVMPVLKVAAPTIAAAIGGPFGAAFGYVMPVLASAFGAKPNDLSDIVSKISGNPLAEKNLREIEEQHGDWVSSLMDSANNLVSAEINIRLNWNPDVPQK